jgi:hypothetical protein
VTSLNWPRRPDGDSRGGAAAAGAFAAIVGTGIAIAASQNGPVDYGNGPVY